MDERALAKAVEPIIDIVLDLEKKVKSIQLIPGEPGKDANPEAIIELLMEKHSSDLIGPEGIKGEDAVVDVDYIIKNIMEEHGSALKVEPGKDAEELDIDCVTKRVIGDDDFALIVQKSINDLFQMREEQCIIEIDEILK